MSLYPYNPGVAQTIQSDVPDVHPNRGFLVNLQWSAEQLVGKAVAQVHAAVQDIGAEQTITADIIQPTCCRSLSVSAAGESGDIGAIQVTIHGTNYNDEVISEVMPIFVDSTPGTKYGVKAFKTVTSIVIPAHDGTGATTSVGMGDKLGIPYKRRIWGFGEAFRGANRDTGTPTMTFDADHLELNTYDPSGSIAGVSMDFFMFISSGD